MLKFKKATFKTFETLLWGISVFRAQGNFLKSDTKAQSIKEKIYNFNYVKIKNFSSFKVTTGTVKISTNWEKIFATHITGNLLISRIKFPNLGTYWAR